MDTMSLWKIISKRFADYPSHTKDIEVDVAIIGGGITGITAANELINAGKKVAILEADLIGGVTTGSSTGNLYIAVQPFYQNILAKFNFDVTKNVAQSRKFAIDYIEKNVTEKKLACQFKRRPWYAYTCQHPRIALDKEVDLFKKMDIPIDYTSELPLALTFNKAIVMENQARFNPLQYVIGMANDLAQQGCLIYEKSPVIKLNEKEEYVLVETRHAKVTAKKVLLATHTPIGINITQQFTAPYRSYVVAVKVKNNNYPEGHFWDLDRPPHATCTHAIHGENPELLMVAGSHHKTGQGIDTQLHFHDLESFLRQHVDVEEIVHQWSAQHYQSADNLPYIGLVNRTAKHTFMATGYWADGLVYGTLAGIIISQMISEKENSMMDIYQSKRCKPIASLPFLAKEGTNVFLQYLKDLPQFSQPTYSDIKAGEGKIISIKQEKCGVSRDSNNQLHIVSAVCPHMKCILNWNNAEKTWDCPCHGSRFTQQGIYIEGPAESNLEKKEH